MKRLYLPLLLFFIMVLEGVALDLLPEKLYQSDLLIVPHWVLLGLILIAIFYDLENTYFSVLHAAIFGLLIDVVYTGILGIYMFTYAVTIYIVHGLAKFLHGNFLSTLLFVIFGILVCDISINILYLVVGITNTSWKLYFIYRLLPTLGANVLFLFIMYPVLSKRLEIWKNEQLDKINT